VPWGTGDLAKIGKKNSGEEDQRAKKERERENRYENMICD